MTAPISFGYTADFKLGALSVPVTLHVDTPVVKKRLLFDIVEDIKDGREPCNSPMGFMWHLQSDFESFGGRIFDFPAEEPDFESITPDFENVLEILETIWKQEFPDGSPKEVQLTINLSLTTGKLTRGLAFAWSDGDPQGEGVTEISIDQISAYDVIYWTGYVYIYSGELELDDAEFYEEPYRLCEAVVQHWFGFLDNRFDYGCRSIFLQDAPNAPPTGDGTPDPVSN